MIVAGISLLYAPVIYYLKDMHSYNKYEETGPEENVLMGDPPTKEYQTYHLQEGKPSQNGAMQGGQAEYYEQVSQQETELHYQEQAPSANPFRAAQGANPFRR